MASSSFGQRLLWVQHPRNQQWWPALKYESSGQALQELSSVLDQASKTKLAVAIISKSQGQTAYLIDTSEFLMLSPSTKTLDFYQHLNSLADKSYLERPMQVVQEFLERDMHGTASVAQQPMALDTSIHTASTTAAAIVPESQIQESDSSLLPSNLSNTDTWAQVWHKMRRFGWKLKMSAKSRKEYWMAPNASRSTGTLGEDYFTSLQDLQTYVQQYCNYRQDEQDDSKKKAASKKREREQEDDTRIWGRAKASKTTTPTNQATKPQDPGLPLLSSDEEEDDYSWKPLWERLKKQGWVAVKAGRFNSLHDWYYVRPGKSVPKGTLGKDYFLSTTEVIAHVKNLEMDASIQKETTNWTSPRKKSRTQKVPDKKPAAQVKSRAVSSKAVPQKRKKSWWFHKEPLPAFKEVWRTLERKLDFKYCSAGYRLPNGRSQKFRSDLEMRAHLVQHGIPNLSKLSPGEERTELLRWVTFCHVPVKEANSVLKLEGMQEWTDDEAWAVLKQDLGYSLNYYGPDGTISRGAESYENLEQLRVHIRGTAQLMPEPTDGRRRCRGSNPKKLSDETVLGLRLWAALAPTPLATHPDDVGFDNASVAEVNGDEIKKSEQAVVEKTGDEKNKSEEEKEEATEDASQEEEKSSSVVSGTPQSDQSSPTSKDEKSDEEKAEKSATGDNGKSSYVASEAPKNHSPAKENDNAANAAEDVKSSIAVSETPKDSAPPNDAHDNVLSTLAGGTPQFTSPPTDVEALREVTECLRDGNDRPILEELRRITMDSMDFMPLTQPE